MLEGVTGLTSSAINLVTTPATNASHARPAVLLLLMSAYIAWNKRGVASSPDTARLVMDIGDDPVFDGIANKTIQTGVARYSVHPIKQCTFSGGTITGEYEGVVLRIDGLASGVWTKTAQYFFPWASIEALTSITITGSALP